MRIIDNQYPERKIAAIYSKRDLEKLFNLQSMRSSLKNITIDKKIAGRYYQEAAVRAVCESFDDRNRRKAWDMLFQKSYSANGRDELSQNSDAMKELEELGKTL